MIDGTILHNPAVSIEQVSGRQVLDKQICDQPISNLEVSGQMSGSGAFCYEFVGCHLLASLTGCRKDAIANHEALMAAMKVAVEAAGATVLELTRHVFPNGALTVVILLSESHAAIHTYPEYGSCFVDIFTCGSSCRPEEYLHSLCSYFCPDKIDKQIIWRGTTSNE